MVQDTSCSSEQKKSVASKLKFWGNGNAKTNEIQKLSESMKLSSEPTKKQKVIPTQIQTLATSITPQQTPVPQQIQKPQIQQTQATPIQQAIPKTQLVQPPIIQQTQQRPPQQIPIQQAPQQTQQRPSILQQMARPTQRPVQRQVPRQIIRQAPMRTQPQTLQLRQGQLTKDLQKIKPKGKGHKKEILLLLILLALIGALVATIIYRDVILGWFS